VTLARLEGLDAHAAAVEVRLAALGTSPGGRA
jgi:histidinol dehydrogenase